MWPTGIWTGGLGVVSGGKLGQTQGVSTDQGVGVAALSVTGRLGERPRTKANENHI